MGEVHCIFGKKGHAVPLGEEELVEAGTVRGRDIEIIRFWNVLPLLEVEDRQTELQKRKIERRLLDPFVKLDVIGKEPFYVVQLGHQSRKLAVKRHEMGCFYLAKDQVELMVEVGTIDLHSANYMRYAPSINSPQKDTKIMNMMECIHME